MRIKIKTKAKSVWNARKRELVRHALSHANWYLALYTWEDKVTIRLSGDEYSPGLCCDMGDRIVIKLSGAQSDRDIVEVLFHELTHAVQYACDDLRDVEEGTLWHGKLYEGDFEDTSTKEYWDAPWEVEARTAASNLISFYHQI